MSLTSEQALDAAQGFTINDFLHGVMEFAQQAGAAEDEKVRAVRSAQAMYRAKLVEEMADRNVKTFGQLDLEKQREYMTLFQEWQSIQEKVEAGAE